MFIVGSRRREFTPEFTDEAVKLVANQVRQPLRRAKPLRDTSGFRAQSMLGTTSVEVINSRRRLVEVMSGLRNALNRSIHRKFVVEQ